MPSRETRSRLLTLLAMVLAAMALVWWARREERANAPLEVGGPLVPGFDPAQVEVLRLTLNAGQAIELHREAAGLWWITSPTREFVRQERIETILLNIAQALAMPMPTDGATVAAADLGLDPPRHIIGWIADGRERTLLLGSPDPLGEALYVRRDGSDQVLLGPRSLATLLDTNAQAFVDPSLLREARGGVTRLRLLQGGQVRLDATRRSSGWTLQSPSGLLADDDRLDQLVRSLQFLMQDQVIDAMPRPESLHALGLPTREEAAAGDARGATRLEVTTTAGESVSIWLAAGWQDQSDLVPAVRSDFAKVLGIARPALSLLDHDVDWFRARRLLPPVRERARSVRLERNGDVLLDIRRQPDGAWTFAQPERLAGEDVESERVAGHSVLGEFLGRIDAVEASGFTDPPSGEPVARLEVGWTRAGEDRVDRVDIHAARPDGLLPAVTSERPTEGLLLPAATLDLFDPLQADLLRSLSPLRTVDGAAWTRIEVRAPGAAAPLVARLEEGATAWEGDDEWARRYALGRDLLRGLRGFRWVPARSPDAPAPAGPIREVKLERTDGTPLADLSLRPPEPDEDQEALGFPVARVALAARPGVELLVSREWLDRIDDLARPLVRKP